ncbi:Hypothetical Protein FCC1311_079912 [Hondaea fermentalgiana]|uniref:Uncharacterized protein n=1 Tax=Hondaea fermentalgiana TaxID=2315210 RepID=A0A2R5GLJ0_9STRA|nr:Hypothetical Protein FCC1311_079912 [Hondaea fermentalgiana]|eukprot:GBG31766.1 Hypothetical Protein FCC1311_079912 [Hondaea fermentalgiana]
MSSPSQQYHAVGSGASGDNMLAMMHHEDDDDEYDDEEDDEGDLERDADGLEGTGDEEVEAANLNGRADGGRKKQDGRKSKRPSNRPRSASSTTYEVHRLDESKKMKQMDIMVTGDRMPTEVNHRRWIVIGLFALFGVILTVVVILEVTLHGAKDDLVSIMERDATRRDVYLIHFSAAGRRVTWADTDIIESIGMAQTLVQRLGSVPFSDFSIEMYKRELTDDVEIAVVEEDNDKIDTDIVCTNEAIQTLTKVGIKRCSPRAKVSALKEAVTCDYSASGRMISFWQKSLKDLGVREGLNSRCCDHDQVADNVSNELELCRASIPSDSDPAATLVFRYYTKPKDSKTCHVTMCGCECISDSVCPTIPADMLKDNKLCKTVLDLKTTNSIKCVDVPKIAQNYASALQSAGITMEGNPRCYGRSVHA